MYLRLSTTLLVSLTLLQMLLAQDLKPVVTTSLLGQPLRELTESSANQIKKDSLLKIAEVNFQKDSNALNNIIWYGRRIAYLTRYPEAIKVFTEGLLRHPNSAELYRHRGHRYLSMRQIDLAILDFEQAVKLSVGREIQIEPDGIPNKLNRPLSSLQFNIYYHLGLAHYLKHDWHKAIAAYTKCMEYSINHDLKVATADWLFMTYRRAGLHEKADSLLKTIGSDLQIIENDSYYKRLKFYQGKLNEEALLQTNAADSSLALATQGYGLGNWYFYQGDEVKAKSIFQKVLSTGYWPAFGYLAAEADLSKMPD